MPFALGAAVGSDAPSAFTTLSVQGTAYGTKDTEFVTISASNANFARSAGPALRENAKVLDRLRQAIKTFGVADDDFRTSSFEFSEGRDPDDEDGSDRAKGFLVNQSLAVVVRDVGRTGDVIEKLVDAGAKNIRVNRGWGYAAAPVGPELSALRTAAVRDAQAKAEDYAKALGLKIRRAVMVRDGSAYTTDGPAPAAVARADVAMTRIDSPKSTLVYNVGVEFELGR
ncbi:SIMPL domain-containing protein [Sphingomonas sp. SUN039]|uniref:SIMPL domain-containing protein n=1 Tax=Sphingomonas sp. SUN039 TaxID=2937787 RepID=UPI002164412B|nr:SIMPL domain-containing protein [Sphingomonas sp. SUN039]UVO52937.1 SIMPL domain-containing protein [Sphingomonas sp. SUN039]